MKNTNATTDIYQVHDSFFHKIFDNPENARDFLERVLPGDLKKNLDLDNIEIEDTKYVSNLFKKGFSDIVLKTTLKKKIETLPAGLPLYSFRYQSLGLPG